MRKITLIVFLLAIKINADAKTVFASIYGYTTIDATAAFQKALISNADTVIIDKQVGNWIVEPNQFINIHDKTIIFEPGVVLLAKPGAFKNTSDCLMSMSYCVNIKILGYGATFKMNKAEYALLADGEYRHSISMNNCHNIQIYGLKISESGGDGIYINGSGTDPYSENIVLKDLWCDNHYRQGISIISVQHLLVQNCWFTNTSGTLPMAGLDVEPNHNTQSVVDVVFNKCRFTGNYGNGIAIAVGNLDNTSIPIDITFNECYSSGNHDVSNTYTPAEIAMEVGKTNAVKGVVKFEQCLVVNSKWTAVFIRKTENSFFASFDNCTFQNVSEDATNTTNTPIWIEVTDYSNPCPRFGGASFNNCLISYNLNLNFIGSYGDLSTCPGMGNVKINNLTVINPHPYVSIDVTSGGGAPDTSCKFDFHKFTSSPASKLDFEFEKNTIECTDDHDVLHPSRIADNNKYPLGFTYSISGTATQGLDYSLLNGFIIIPANSNTANDTIFIFNSQSRKTQETILLSLDKNPSFTSDTLTKTITVLQCSTGLTSEYKAPGITVYPNPANDYLSVKFAEDFNGQLKVVNESGQLVYSQIENGKYARIYINDLAKGVYFLTFKQNNGLSQQTACRFVKI